MYKRKPKPSARQVSAALDFMQSDPSEKKKRPLPLMVRDPQPEDRFNLNGSDLEITRRSGGTVSYVKNGVPRTVLLGAWHRLCKNSPITEVSQ